MKRRISILLVLVLGLTFQLHAETAANKKLKFAAVLGLSGYAAHHAKYIKNGVTLAVEKLEKEGWDVDVVFEDDKTNPSQTVSAVRSLLARGYKFFVGPTWSFQIKAAKPILESSNALSFVPGGSSLINGGTSDSVFSMCPTRTKQVPVVADWIIEQGVKRIYIVTAHGDWGEIHQKVVTDAIKETGIELVGEQYFDYGADLSTIKTILLKAMKTDFDALFVTCSSDDIANFTKARSELKKDFSILTTDTLADAIYFGLIPEDKLSNVHMTYLPISPEFSEVHKERFGEEAHTYSDRGYDAVMILAQAVAATDGSVDAVRDYIKNSGKLVGFSGPLKFDRSGDIDASSYEIKSYN